MNEYFDIVKWQGIKNCDTKKVCTGYLYLKFKQPTILLSTAPNVVNAIPKTYGLNETIGFSVTATNRKEAILIFMNTHIITKWVKI